MPGALANAYHNLSSLLDAGVPVLRSLKTVSPGLKHRTQRAFLGLAEGVSKGDTLAETMRLHPKVFSPVDVMLVEVAERSGNLPDMIGLLSKWHEISNRMLKKVLFGLIKPTLVLVLAAFLIPIPDFALGGWDVDHYRNSVVVILLTFSIPAVILFLLICFTPKTGFLRRQLDRVVLRVPLCFGRAMRNLALSRYCWAFHMLSAAGVPITHSVKMAASVTGNAVIGDLFKPAVESVNAGSTICEGLSSNLPIEFVEMWNVGEETGQLDEVSKRMAARYTEAAEFWFEQFSRWFPVVVYTIVAIYLIINVFKGYGRIYSGIGF